MTTGSGWSKLFAGSSAGRRRGSAERGDARTSRAKINPPPSATQPLFHISLVILTVGVLLCRFGGLNPESLRLDDQWLALIATRMSFSEFLQLRPPTPIGFVAVQSFLARLWPDPEWPLQVAPVTASVLQVPLFAALLRRITSCSYLALLGAVLLAVNPQLADYGVTAKHYASDSLATVCLLWFGYPLLLRWNSRRAFAFVGVAAVALLFAFPSVFTSVALVSAAVLFCLLREDQRRLHLFALASWLSLTVVLGMLYFVLLRGQSNLGMRLYWADYFIHFDTAAEALQSSAILGYSAISGALPDLIRLAAILAAVGLAACMAVGRRSLGVCLGLILLGAYLAAALRIYPLGTGRTDIHLYPVVITLIVLAIDAGLRWLRVAGTPKAVAVGALCVAAALLGRVSVYEHVADADVVRQLERLANAEQLVLIYPHAEFAVAYYTDWPAEFRHSAIYAHGFAMEFSRPGTKKLPPPDSGEDYPLQLQRTIDQFLGGEESELLYVATHIFPPGHELIRHTIRRNGFVPVSAMDRPQAQLLRYRRGGGQR